MMRWLYRAALLAALPGTFGCNSNDEPFSDSNSGGTGGNGGATGGQSGMGGEGGSPTSDTLEDPQTVRDWANLASALAVYAAVYEPFAIADGEASFPDADCPSVTDDGTRILMAGDCTEDAGKEWVGYATVDRLPNGDSRLTLDGYGTASNHLTGESNRVRIDDTHHHFDIDLVNRADTFTTVYAYSGDVTGDYDTRTVWTGSGTVTRTGDQPPLGTILAATTDEVRDDAVCASQSASGNTTLEDEVGNVVVVTYDGSVDCDEDLAASYSLNGAAQGTITGIACSYAPGSRSSRLVALFALLFALGALGTRRRPRVRSRSDEH